jgi:isocitrate/isopropylmalate dehydrogenase
MAFEIALGRQRKVKVIYFDDLGQIWKHAFQHLTIIHKSNVLSITDGLFRETVRAVPQLPLVNGKYDSVTLMEQLVDSAVYR